jgi:hypothetical protein
MIKKALRAHPYKIIVGAPIIFLVLVSGSSILGGGNYFSFTGGRAQFAVVGDEIPVTLDIHTKVPINAVGGTVHFDPSVLAISSLSRISSSVDLWSEEPVIDNTEGTLHFSGGLFGEKTDAPLQGTIFVINMTARTPGKTNLTVTNGEILANNGEGTNVSGGARALTLYIRAAGLPSPDVNGDGILSASDANILYLKTFRAYDSAYDLNGDGKVNWTDVRDMIALF